MINEEAVSPFGDIPRIKLDDSEWTMFAVAGGLLVYHQLQAELPEHWDASNVEAFSEMIRRMLENERRQFEFTQRDQFLLITDVTPANKPDRLEDRCGR